MCSARRGYFFFCLAVAQCGCPCGTICSVAFFVTVLHIKQQWDQCYSFFHFRRIHLPHSPVRPGPHLLQIPVPIRYFPCGFVDFLAVIAGSDSLRHAFYYKNNQIRSLREDLLCSFCLFRRYTPIVPDPTYALTLDHCAALRVSRSGRTLRSPKATPESCWRPTIKGEKEAGM